MNDKFEKVRQYFPHTKNIVFFNTAAYGPLSIPIKEAIVQNIDLRMAAEIDDTRQMYELRDRVREGYARMIGAETSQIGVNVNTSYGLNVAAYGLPLKEGDEILLSDVEFPATIYCWRGASEIRKLKLTFLKSKDRKFDMEEMEKSITSRTRVLSLSFVQFFNGYKNNLESISKICKRHGLFFVVDGIQGTGAEPIDVKKLGIDIFSCGCQKWLLAPFGSSFFYISDSVKDIVAPYNITWYAADWKLQFTDLFKYRLPYFDTAEKFQGGYYATLNLLGMEAASKIISELGIENIQKHNHALIDRLAEYLKQNDYFTITSSLKEIERSSILTFTCDNLADLHRFLIGQKVYTACREGSIRAAVHLFNDESDIERLLEALELFVRQKVGKVAGKAT